MKANKKESTKSRLYFVICSLFFLVCIFLIIEGFFVSTPEVYQNAVTSAKIEPKKDLTPVIKPLDKEAYDLKLKELANNPPPVVPKPIVKKVKDPKTGKITLVSVPAPVIVPKPNLWPVQTVYPNAGAILPFNRIVAYYGNLYSKKMGGAWRIS